ncbi:MAG: DUF3710 domain-containing protein [Nesterenkonia sp.]|nr:DUF3710 domain-containing protein [Nesterenkonia sp.]
MIFGRRRKKERAEPATISETLARQSEDDAADPVDGAADRSAEGSGDAQEPAEHTESAPAERAAASDRGAAARPKVSGEGPYDIAQADVAKGFLDFGAVKVPVGRDQKVRLDIDQRSRRVIALTISAGQASIQIQPFSAPKSGGTWEEVRAQIRESITSQKGRAREVDGTFGTEVVARVPTTLKDGRAGWRVARFIGAEGPRWFLRGVIGGRGAIDPQAAAEVEDLFSRLVVERGGEPLPPRELLPLRQPEGATRVVRARRGAERTQDGPSVDPAQQPESRPEDQAPDDAAGRTV